MGNPGLSAPMAKARGGCPGAHVAELFRSGRPAMLPAVSIQARLACKDAQKVLLPLSQGVPSQLAASYPACHAEKRQPGRQRNRRRGSAQVAFLLCRRLGAWQICRLLPRPSCSPAPLEEFDERILHPRFQTGSHGKIAHAFYDFSLRWIRMDHPSEVTQL
jgi:hypothetical protein